MVGEAFSRASQVRTASEEERRGQRKGGNGWVGWVAWQAWLPSCSAAPPPAFPLPRVVVVVVLQLVPQDGDAWWVLDGDLYKLQQAHFHSPSEHRINGAQFPLEVHFVHTRWGPPVWGRQWVALSAAHKATLLSLACVAGSPSTGAWAVFSLLYNISSDGAYYRCTSGMAKAFRVLWLSRPPPPAWGP